MLDSQIVEQKKHDKPIRITDIAINKVPCTHIGGFTGEQNAFIQERHKEILRTARDLCKKHKNDEMEAIILVNAHTWKYWVIEGKEAGNADIADNSEAKNALQTSSRNSLLLLHNHPSAGTFSGTDFITFCFNTSLYLMTVVGNDGTVYVLIKNTDFDSGHAMADYFKLVRENADKKDRAQLAMKAILNNSGDYGLIYKKGRKKL
jgi:hypothetical protein